MKGIHIFSLILIALLVSLTLAGFHEKNRYFEEEYPHSVNEEK
jgi:hypothetical protein